MIARLALLAGLGLSTVVLGTACSTATIESERDKAIPISKGATFSWGQIDPAAKATDEFADFDNPKMRSRLEGAIDNFLLNKGLQRTSADKADFILTYHIGFKSSTDKQARMAAPTMVPTVRCAGNRCTQTMTWGNYGSPIESMEEYEYREGALIIDLQQRSSGKLAWRGIYSDLLGEADKVSDARIAEVVAKTMKDAVR